MPREGLYYMYSECFFFFFLGNVNNKMIIKGYKNT